jgi:hypothetical protein
MSASYKGHVRIVRCLSEQAGHLINEETVYGWTALLLACDLGHTEVGTPRTTFMSSRPVECSDRGSDRNFPDMRK